jgi:peptide/nickel transport system permease protein
VSGPLLAKAYSAGGALLSSLRSITRDIGKTASGKIGLGITGTILLVAIFAPFIAPYSPTAFSGKVLAPPSMKHLLGTDDIGEDIFSQLIYGIRGSMEIAIFAGAIALLMGAGIGLVSGFYGGKLEEVLMRATDVVLVVPTLVLLLTVAAYTVPSVTTVIILIGILSWPGTARVIRSSTLTLKDRPFIDSSRMSGMRDIEIIFRIIVPLELPLLFLYGVLAAISAVVIETGFDLIGLGSLTNISLGTILFFAFSDNAVVAGEWWWFLPPGLIIGVLGTGLLFIGYNAEKLRNRL